MAMKTVSSIIKDLTPEPSPSAQPGDLVIDELTLLRLTRAAEKGRAAGLEITLATNALNRLVNRFLQENEDARKLSQRMTELQAEAKAAQETYTEIVKKISSELKIDMKEYSYDDETGVLRKIAVKPPEEASTPPVEPPPPT